MNPSESSVRALAEALTAPFDPSDVKLKPQVVKGNRALAVAYVDARAVEDRLDEVLGVDGWRDEYEVLACGSVVCHLSLRIDGVWITKADVGSQSEQPDDGDKVKAAFSDALKRAAVKFGIGRYLYRLPQRWLDYDPVRKHFVQPPAQIPGKRKPEALPAAPAPARPATVTPEQGKVITGLIAGSGLPLATFLGKYGIGRLEQLPASQFDDACRRLREYGARNGVKAAS